MSCFTSDHRLILLTLDAEGEKQRWRSKPFRFKAKWMTDLGCHNIVVRAWESNPDGLPMYRTTKKLKKCKKMLKKWSTAHFGNVTRQIKKVKELLWKAEEESVRTGDIQEVVRLKSELNLLIDREEQMWHQRSHVKWIQCGD